MSATDPFGLVGQVLDGQFRVDKLVGEGGFSAVYRGHHQGLNEPIAIKSLKLPSSLDPSLVDTFVQRFRDESRILYRLSQGNLHVVRSIAAGTTQAPTTGALVPYMVLEWLEGRSLQNDFTVRRTLGKTGRTLDEVLKLFSTAADGLAYAHAQGVVHRDLNPGNLFLATTQQGVKMKVLDFGVAKLMHDGALNMGPRHMTIGQIKIFAPAYGAPEQFDDRIGAVGAFSDVHAFALILIEALRDRSVNEGTHLGEFAQQACDPAQRPTPRALGIDVPDEVEAAFARATTLDPKERWQSAGDFWQSLVIASKMASEHRHDAAARETPPLAMGSAAKGGKLARTIPLGSGGTAAPRPRTPTTIGIPPPGVAGRPAEPARVEAAAAAPPRGTPAAIARTLALPSAVAPASALGSPAPPARSPSRPPSSPPHPVINPKGAPMPNAALPASSRGHLPPSPSTGSLPSQEEEEEATTVHAPEPEILRTLALHDAASARAAADVIVARERASRDAQARAAGAEPVNDMQTKPPQPPEATNVAAEIPEPPSSGGTLMMAPTANPAWKAVQDAMAAQRGKGGLGSTLAMPSPLNPTPVTSVASGTAPTVPQPAREAPKNWQVPTQAMMPAAAPAQPPVQAAPGMQGIAGAHGTPPQGVPAVNYAPAGYSGSSSQLATTQPNAQPFGRPSSDQLFPVAPSPPSQAAPAPPKAALPVLPIIFVCAALALGGIALGFFALRARHAARVDTTASATASEIAAPPASTAPAATTEPVPTAVATAAPVVEVAEVDAAPATTANATPEVASASPSSASAAPSAKPASSAPAAPPFGQAPPVPPPVTAPPSAKPPVDPNAFSESTARARLALANGVLAFCKKEGGQTGPGSASVTFGPDGSVMGVAIDAPYAGTKEGDCAAGQFRRAKVNAFQGPPQTVRHTFDVPK